MPRIPPRSGVVIELDAGRELAVRCPEGEQVADLTAFAAEDPREWLSSGKTLDFESTLLLTRGNTLWSNRGRELLDLVEDTCGRHDFLLAPCCPETFRRLYGITQPRPSCHANLAAALAPYGIGPDRIPTAFNVFMHVAFDPEGRLEVRPPLARPGDQVVFRARVPLLIGLTACSAEQSNNGRFKPIDFQLRSPA